MGLWLLCLSGCPSAVQGAAHTLAWSNLKNCPFVYKSWEMNCQNITLKMKPEMLIWYVSVLASSNSLCGMMLFWDPFPSTYHNYLCLCCFLMSPLLLCVTNIWIFEYFLPNTGCWTMNIEIFTYEYIRIFE